MLLRSGDVESNPGPNQSSQQTTDRRKTRQTTLLGTYATAENDQCELSDIMRELRNVKVDLGRKMDKLSSDLHKKIDDLSHDINDVQRELEEAREETARLAEENKALSDQVCELTRELDSMNGQMKRDNLIFKGLDQDENESWDQTESKVKSFITEKLGIDGEIIEFDRVHRLTNARTRPQPIIAKFSRYQQRKQVFEAAKNLKGTDFQISEDFTRRVRDTRRKLGRHLAAARNEGKRAFLSFDKLKIDGTTYVYDTSSDDIRPLSRRDFSHS
ncbi:uncharacterized protein [Ptychodera flava]|uniref:uncharacterized protein n=1 Tax=Ptychodera flava TaxID=63121 RepID=UPI003969BC44